MLYFRLARSVRFAMGVSVMLLVALVQSCSELRYSLFGRSAEARVTSVQPSALDMNRDVLVHYTFEDDQWRPVRGKFSVSRSKWEARAGNTVDVVYISNNPEGTSKPVMLRSWVWPVILPVFVGVGVIWLVNAMRLAKQGVMP